MRKYHTVIYGSDMANYAHAYKLNDLDGKIDPKGINVVAFSMIHNDTDIRAMMLIKLLNQNDPHETTIDFPLEIWNKITQKLYDAEDPNAAPN